MRAIFGIVAIGLLLVACGATRISTPRYIVTTAPIAVRVGHSVGLCIAVDPADPQGVWWWEPAPAARPAPACSARNRRRWRRVSRARSMCASVYN